MPKTEEEYRQFQNRDSGGAGINQLDIEQQPQPIPFPGGAVGDSVYYTSSREPGLHEPLPRSEPQMSDVISDLLSKHSYLRPPASAEGVSKYHTGKDLPTYRNNSERYSVNDPDELSRLVDVLKRIGVLDLALPPEVFRPNPSKTYALPNAGSMYGSENISF